jgi:hypothetical protein
MAEVKHFLDRDTIQGDADFLKPILADILKQLQTINNTKISLQGSKSFGEAATQLKQMQAESAKLADLQLKIAKAETEYAKAKVLSNKAETESVRTKKTILQYEDQLLRSKDKLAKKQEKETKELEKAANAYAQLSKSYIEASALSKKRGAELLKEANGNEALFQSLLKTDKEYLSATKSALSYYKQLDLLENSVGQAQRRVGQYERAQFSLNQVLREAPAFVNSLQTGFLAISNNLPILADEFKRLRESTGSGFQALKILAGGLFSFQTLLLVGITALTAYGKEIGEFFSNLTKGTESINKAEAAAKSFNEAFSDSNVKDAVKTVSELANNVELAKKGLIDKEKVVKQYNETMGKTTGTVKSLDEVEQQLVKNGPAYIRMTILKAAADNARKQAGDKIIEALKIQQQDADEFVSSVEKGFNSLNKLGTLGSSGTEKQADINNEKAIALAAVRSVARKRAAQRQAEEEAKVYEDIANSLTNQAAKIAKALKFDFFGGDFTDKKEVDKNAKDFKKFLAKARLDYAKTIQDLIALGDEFDKRIVEENDRRLNDLFNGLQTGFAKEVERLELQRSQELLRLNEVFAKGDIGLATFKRFESETQDEYNFKIIQAEIEHYSQLISILKGEGLSVVSAEKALADAKLKIQQNLNKQKELLYKSDNEKAKDANKAARKDAQDYADFLKSLPEELKKARQELIKEVQNTIKEVVLGGFDRQKNAIQGQINLIDEQKRKEIDAINATTLSAQEKAARITNAEKKAQNERERLELRQRQIDQQRAKFERAFSIVQIVAKTAEAIAAQLKYLPASAPLIALTAAIGAAQIAAVVSRPIPRFKTGKGEYDKYEGPAWVGDGGKSEMIFRESGEVEKTPSTPIMTWVGKNDIIHPDADALLNHTLQKQAAVMNYASDNSQLLMLENISTELKAVGNQVSKEIRNKREWFVNINNGQTSLTVKDGTAWKRYLNNNLQFGK